MPIATRIEVGTRPGFKDSRAVSISRQIVDYLGVNVEGVRTRDVYHVVPALSDPDATRIAAEFAGPVLRQSAVGRLEDGGFDVAVTIGYSFIPAPVRTGTSPTPANNRAIDFKYSIVDSGSGRELQNQVTVGCIIGGISK